MDERRKICGHTKESLIWACGDEGEIAIPGCDNPTNRALSDVRDSAKLAAILTEVGCGLGLSIRLRLRVYDGEWPDFEVLHFPNPSVPHERPMLGFYARQDRKNWDLEMPQARRLLLEWLQLDDGDSERATQILRAQTNCAK